LGGVVIAIQQPAAVLIYTKRSQACNALWRYGEGFLFFYLAPNVGVPGARQFARRHLKNALRQQQQATTTMASNDLRNYFSRCIFTGNEYLGGFS